MKRPDFFIVGAPKSGTTSLYTYLRQHPDIFMPDWKEPNFFCTDLDASYPYALRDSREYERLFENASGNERVGEASTWYLYSRSAARNIHEFHPDARIIAILRNPVEMIYSLHGQRLYTRNENIASFRQALDAETLRKRGEQIPSDVQLTQGLFYRDVGKYHEQVRRYIDVFGRERVYVSTYDELANDPASLYRDIAKFLGVDPSFEPRFTVENPGKKLRSAWLHFTLSPMGRARSTARALLPKGMRDQLRWSLVLLLRVNVQPSGRGPMAPDLYRSLQQEFAPDIERLSALLDRDLSRWVAEA